MQINLESLVLKNYDRMNMKHFKYRIGLESDTQFQKYFGHFFIKNIDEIFCFSNEIEIGKAYIIEENNNVIGMVRIFKKNFNKEITFQYAVSKEYRSEGYGTKILKEVSDYLINCKDINSIVLDIDKNNINSTKCALNAGYRNEEDVYFIKR